MDCRKFPGFSNMRDLPTSRELERKWSHAAQIQFWLFAFLRLGGKVSAASLHRKLTRPHLDQVGLFLGCVSCHSSSEVFFLLNFLVAEGGCEVFGLEDLANLYVGLAYVGTALDPLDGLFERLDLPEPEAGDEFLAFGEGAVGDGALLAGEVDAGTFGGGVKTVVAQQDSGF